MRLMTRGRALALDIGLLCAVDTSPAGAPRRIVVSSKSCADHISFFPPSHRDPFHCSPYFIRSRRSDTRNNCAPNIRTSIIRADSLSTCAIHTRRPLCCIPRFPRPPPTCQLHAESSLQINQYWVGEC